MRSIWSGDISVSLLNMPVKLGSTTQDNELGLRMVRKSDGSQIKFKRVAEADGQEVEWNDTAKGYDAPDGSLVILDKADFDEAYGPKNRVASLLMFTDASNVPPLASKTSYWVQPGKGGEKIYALLAQALQRSGKVAILTLAVRQREAVAVLRPQDGYLSLEPLNWDADILRPDFAAPPQTATGDEVDMALRLIDQLTEKYDHAAQADTSTEKLTAVIQAKIERGDIVAPPARPEGTGPQAAVDLMSALAAAVETSQKAAPAPAPRTRKTAAKAREEVSA